MMNGVERYLAPTSLIQALAVLGGPGGTVVLAGGTDLMPQSNAGKVRPAGTLLNIRRIEALDLIVVDGATLVLGSLVTIGRLQKDALVREHAPVLVEVAERSASRSAIPQRSAATCATRRRPATRCRRCWRWTPSWNWRRSPRTAQRPRGGCRSMASSPDRGARGAKPTSCSRRCACRWRRAGR